ncbi:MAG: bifunctional phosphopantothenoylcysteine decarboxylase/phosphopantothenate--cysteine ligase CoaBC [FCB group bacterium]|nr:bifunctional phosphopantothenoylcysteine decarboxylase/phosphopantothenate--cysteine ligase CoaBC [FCB group bacterium]
MSRGKILFMITGSIAAYKAATVISRLVQAGYDVQSVVSRNALNFIGTATLEGLTGHRVLGDLYEPGQMMSHIDLVKWADLTIIAPATANVINQLAHGNGQQLHTALFLAHDWSKPFILAPAMNTNMYQHPATQASIKTLLKWGVTVLPTAEGTLACGDEGIGRMLEPDDIIRAILKELGGKRNHGTTQPTVLITAGGTREALDAVRFLGNISTGYTGAALADFFTRAGWEVIYLHGPQAIQPTLPCSRDSFSSVTDLREKLSGYLTKESLAVVIHLAAVSDFSPKLLTAKGKRIGIAPDQKLSSTTEALELRLVPTPKLVNSIKMSAANPNLKLVAFKLTAGAELSEVKSAIRDLFQRSRADVIVTNDMNERIQDRQQKFQLFTTTQPEDGITIDSVSGLGPALETILFSSGKEDRR